MELYNQKSQWKIYLVIFALGIVAVSLWYTNRLAGRIADEERKKVELWASAYKHFNQADENTDLGLIFEVIKNNKAVPVILTTADGEIRAFRNFDSLKVAQNEFFLKNELKALQAEHEPIAIEISPGNRNYIYYKDSVFLQQLKFYPFFQFMIIGIFMLVAYFGFSSSKNAEQNRVWVGMAKETAHQLGTPISSLMAWIEYLKDQLGGKPEFDDMIQELQKDVARLELITDRFSKIGSAPVLEKYNVMECIQENKDYINRRSSHMLDILLKADTYNISAQINPPLFNWVIENLLRNAVDAIEGKKGKIEIKVSEQNQEVVIDIKDSGQGIPKSKFSTVFEPGYSTKKRGWGLGLALVKRIIVGYHKGKIFVKESVIGEGTTFRIVLPR